MYIKLEGTTSELSLRLSHNHNITADAISVIGFYSTFLTPNVKEDTILKYGTQDIIIDKGQYSFDSLVQTLSHIKDLEIKKDDICNKVSISNKGKQDFDFTSLGKLLGLTNNAIVKPGEKIIADGPQTLFLLIPLK